MPEAFRKLNCKLCESGFERTYQILMDTLPKFMRIQRFYCKLCESGFERTCQILLNMLPKFMRIQRFYCKLCEINFEKGHWMKVHVEEFYLNHVQLVL